jgi:DHA1 family bicyclomycin/chloramphenicol resistance-like MFS transporter
MVSSVFAYMSTSSFLFQQQYGLTAQMYGVISAANAIAFVVGTQISALVARRVSPKLVLAVALPVLAAAGFMLLLVGVMADGIGPVIAVMLVFLAFAGACGPCLGALGLADHAKRAGTAAALLGAVNFGLAGIASPLVGALGITTVVPLGAVMGGVMSIATLALWLMVGRSMRARHSARAVT